MVSVSSMTVKTSNMTALVEFYKIIGLDLKPKQVKLGSEIFKTEIGGVELIFYPVDGKEISFPPPFQLSFVVPDLDVVFHQLALLSNATVVMDPIELPDGKMAVVLDPDGHSIELIQKN